MIPSTTQRYHAAFQYTCDVTMTSMKTYFCISCLAGTLSAPLPAISAEIISFASDPRYESVVVANGAFDVGVYHLEQGEVRRSLRQFQKLDHVLNRGEYKVGWISSVDTTPLTRFTELVMAEASKQLPLEVESVRKNLRSVRKYTWGRLPDLADKIPAKLASAYRNSIVGDKIINHL